jgi:hypothetical protein
MVRPSLSSSGRPFSRDVNTWDAVTVRPSPPEHEPTSTIIVSASLAGVTGTVGTLAPSGPAGACW